MHMSGLVRQLVRAASGDLADHLFARIGARVLVTLSTFLGERHRVLVRVGGRGDLVMVGVPEPRVVERDALADDVHHRVRTHEDGVAERVDAREHVEEVDVVSGDLDERPVSGARCPSGASTMRPTVAPSPEMTTHASVMVQRSVAKPSASTTAFFARNSTGESTW